MSPDVAESGTISRTIDGFEMRFPEPSPDRDQDQEWIEVKLDGEFRRIRMHDYTGLYDVPGLYEALVYKALNCTSPERVTGLFGDVLRDWPHDPADLRVLDLGAGNGIVAEHLRGIGVKHIVGLDLLPAAERSAKRDRPHVYDDYLVADLCKLTPEQETRLSKAEFNSLVTVAALGFGDIPPEAFATAFNFVANEGWIAMTIKEDFLHNADQSGFSRLTRLMVNEGVLEMQAHQRYCHRLSMAGDQIFYVVLVGRKLSDVSPAMVQRANDEVEAEAAAKASKADDDYSDVILNS
jgi:SAM-dependent methyltransferase